MIVNLESPPILGGVSTEKDFERMASYLYRTMRVLGDAINNLTPETIEANARHISINSGTTAAQNQGRSDYDELRSIIIKTANVVRSEMDSLFLSMSGLYVAESDFGTYKEDTQAAITANSTAITQNYDYFSQITSDHAVYINDTQAYIKTGLLGTDGGGTPFYGVEIGQQDAGEAAFMTRITSQKMSFLQGDDEVAWVSNKRWHALGIDVETDIQFDGAWAVSAGKDKPFEINYIG